MSPRARILVPVLALTFICGSISGCGGPARAEDGRRDLIIWGTRLTPDTKGMEALMREFERLNPDVRVRTLSMGAGRMDPQKLMTSIVGNVAPDVIEQDRFTISDWASRGAFRPLDELILRDRQDPQCPRPDQYYEAAWKEATYEGKVYGIPTSADNRILYWNKGAFKEKSKELAAAGLDPSRPPRTWSEMLRYSKVLTEFRSDGTLKRAGFMPNFGNCWLYMYAFQMNADFMSADGRKCTMYSPAAEKALQYMVDGYALLGGYAKARSFESGFLGQENDAFILGQVAMKIDGDWILENLARYGPAMDLGVAPPPSPDDRYYQRGDFKSESAQFVTWSGGFSWAIPKGARNVEDAWKFIKFASSVEGQMLVGQNQWKWEQYRGRTYVPYQVGNREANEALCKTFAPPDPKFAAAVKQHLEMAPYARTRPVTFVGQTLWSEHVRAMEAALYKKSSPKEALLESQAVVQRELDAFYEKERYPVIRLSTAGYVAGGAGLIGVAAFLYWFSRQKIGRIARTEARWAYFFLAPWLVGFLLLTLGPMLASLFFSFTQYDVLNEARWVGLKNYFDMFGADKPATLKALGNAAYLAGIGVPLSVATGLAVALLLNAAVRGMRFYRTFFYMPAIIPGTASAILWSWVLTADPNKGLVNAYWARTIGAWFGSSVEVPGWLQSASWGKDGLILMGLWGAGSGMILWLAGLKGVPTTLYEAASIDGASPRKAFWAITFPQLSPIVFFSLVMGVIGAMQEFDRMYIMKPASEGPIGPDDSLLTPVYHLFKNGFAYFKMGYASSLAWMIFAIILVLTFVQFRLAPRWVHYEGER